MNRDTFLLYNFVFHLILKKLPYSPSALGDNPDLGADNSRYH